MIDPSIDPGTGPLHRRRLRLVGVELGELDPGRDVHRRFVMPTVLAEFRAMGTRVRCIGPTESPAFELAVAAVRATFEREERRCSRFRGDSELTRVNASAGTWTTVSEAFARLVRGALDGWARTGGRFDPTLLDALIAAGYDRDFDEVRGRRSRAAPRRYPRGASW